MPALAAALFVLALTAPVGTLSPPVPDPVTAPFRAPACQWCPGHRGLTYATPPGTAVRAAADGVVSFSGVVAGTTYVVVAHQGGLRTTYGHLQRATVGAGTRVQRGEVIGTNGPDLHFGARIGERYVDPAALFADLPRRARLLPLR